MAFKALLKCRAFFFKKILPGIVVTNYKNHVLIWANQQPAWIESEDDEMNKITTQVSKNLHRFKY
jgi:hypothetical protein